MSPNRLAVALATLMETATIVGCGTAKPTPHQPERTVEDHIKNETASSVLRIKVEGASPQHCDIATNDPILTEPKVENKLYQDCDGLVVLQCAMKHWDEPRPKFPFRQLWPEVIAQQELSLYHPGHATFFTCAKGSRMVMAEPGPGPQACLEDKFTTIEEKIDTCGGRYGMTPQVVCNPADHTKSVTWTCISDMPKQQP